MPHDRRWSGPADRVRGRRGSGGCAYMTAGLEVAGGRGGQHDATAVLPSTSVGQSPAASACMGCRTGERSAATTAAARTAGVRPAHAGGFGRVRDVPQGVRAAQIAEYERAELHGHRPGCGTPAGPRRTAAVPWSWGRACSTRWLPARGMNLRALPWSGATNAKVGHKPRVVIRSRTDPLTNALSRQARRAQRRPAKQREVCCGQSAPEIRCRACASSSRPLSCRTSGKLLGTIDVTPG